MRTRLIILTAGLTMLAARAQAQELLGWPEPAVDWSGFYAGVFGGYGLDAGGETTGRIVLNTDGHRTEADTNVSRISTPLGGAEIGYDLQYGAAVFGVGADVTLGGFSKQSSTVGTDIPLDPADGPGMELESYSAWRTGVVGTITGRLGVSAGNWMVYGTGGVAIADVTVTNRAEFNEIGGPAQRLQTERTGLLFGAVVGVGLETMIADNVSLGAEYNYMSFPAQDGGAGAFGLGGGGGLGPVSMHSLKLSAKYHF